MKSNHLQKSRVIVPAAVTALGALIIAACGGGGSGGGSSGAGPAASAASPQPSTVVFTDTALVADKAEVVASAKTVDANLQNPWGIAVATGLPFWIADNNSNLATLYSGAGM
jgi:hypothetical protein